MKDQINTIRSAVDLCLLVNPEKAEKALAALTQFEAMAGEPAAYMLPRDGDDCAVFREPGSFAPHYSPKGWTPLYAAPVAQQPQAEASPTAGMNMAQRILHVGGRNNAAGYVEFGSIQAVEALVHQVLRDLPKPRRIPDHELVAMYDECPRSDSDMLAFAHEVMDAMLATPQQAEVVPPDVVRDAAAYHWLTTTLTSPEPWVVFQKAFGHMTEERPPTKAELDAAIYAAIAQQKGGV